VLPKDLFSPTKLNIITSQKKAIFMVAMFLMLPRELHMPITLNDLICQHTTVIRDIHLLYCSLSKELSHMCWSRNNTSAGPV